MKELRAVLQAGGDVFAAFTSMILALWIVSCIFIVVVGIGGLPIWALLWALLR